MTSLSTASSSTTAQIAFPGTLHLALLCLGESSRSSSTSLPLLQSAPAQDPISDRDPVPALPGYPQLGLQRVLLEHPPGCQAGAAAGSAGSSHLSRAAALWRADKTLLAVEFFSWQRQVFYSQRYKLMGSFPSSQNVKELTLANSSVFRSA